jgi:ribosomal-protein-alanine N-acetyltransferase
MGYLFVTQVMDTADIGNIAVSPEFRRQGIASLLLDTALNGMDADVFLEVRHSNTPAIALYEKYGFQPIGIRKNYYDNPREDAILMQKPRI